HWMRGITDVEQEAVTFARSTGATNCRVDRDVVALGRAGTSRTRRRRRDYSIDHGLQAGTQAGAVGGSRWASAASCLDDAVQRRCNKARRNYCLVAANVRHKSAVGLRFRNLTTVLGD